MQEIHITQLLNYQRVLFTWWAYLGGDRARAIGEDAGRVHGAGVDVLEQTDEERGAPTAPGRTRPAPHPRRGELQEKSNFISK